MDHWSWKYLERPKRIIYSFVFRTILKWDNAKEIQKEANKHRGEIVIDPAFSIVKLLGWTDQYKEDYYWVICRRNEIVLSSCVGGFIYLKGKIGIFEYNHLLELFDMNLFIDVEKELKEKGTILK